MGTKVEISQRGFIGVILLLFLVLLLIVFTGQNHDSSLFSDFIYSSSVCSVLIISSVFILMSMQNSIFTIANISYAFFILFQFGIPYIYATKIDYWNFYATLFDEKVLNNGVIYTTLCILLWCIGLVVANTIVKSGENRILFSKSPIMQDGDSVKKFLKVIISISGVIVIPLYTYYAGVTLQDGFSQETRRMLSSNALYRFGNAFFLPACLLYHCYSGKKYFKGLICAIDFPFLYICVTSLLIGDRNTGISWLLVFIYGIYDNYKRKNNSIIIDFFIIVGVFSLAVIAAFIAQNRMESPENQIGLINFLDSGVFERVIEELGFNFYSIAFINMYVPSVYDYQYGLTYMSSIISLIPSTFDIFGIKSHLVNPTIWLFNANHNEFGTLLDFGTGFSFIAETYMNFSWAGCIVSLIIPILLSNVVGPYQITNGWERYVRLIFLYIFVTFPRRSLVESLVIFEYAIFFLGLYLIIVRVFYDKLIKFRK